MKKISVLALIATLGLAAPALAQTPADVANGRAPAFDSTPEVAVSRDHKTSHAGEAVDLSGDKAAMKHGKKHGKHHAKKAAHHAKRHAKKAEAEVKAEEKKMEDKAGK